MPEPQAVYFFCFLLDLLQPRLLAKKTRNLRAELWSEHFLIYSRLRQMNIESLFVLCANISSISISTEKLRERTALISPLNFSDLSDTLILAPFVFFFSRSRAARWLAQFHSRRWTNRTLTSTPARGNIFSVDFWKVLITHSRKVVAAANIEHRKILASIN